MVELILREEVLELIRSKTVNLNIGNNLEDDINEKFKFKAKMVEFLKEVNLRIEKGLES